MPPPPFFLDTSYLIALASKNDEHHALAVDFRESLPRDARFLTTELVMVELLNFFASRHAKLRAGAAHTYDVARSHSNWKLVRTAEADVDVAVDQYRTARTNRRNSPGLVDVHSMAVMRREGATVALTTDFAFAAAGFETPLISKSGR